METIEVALVIGFLALLLGLFAGRYLWPSAKASDQAALSVAQVDAKRASEARDGARQRADTLEAELRVKSDMLQEAETKAARLDERVSSLSTQLAEQTSALATLETSNSASERSVARLTEREEALIREISDLRSRDGTLQETLRVEFENIATKVMKANTTELSDASQKQLTEILNPLRERISEFQKKVETTYDAERLEVLSLKDEIKRIVETSQSLGTQADGLAKALKGDVQMLGRWGELVLDRVLHAAGLVEGREYISQGRGLGLKGEDGGQQKPDVILLLPEKRTMVVDSKVSLASYDRLIASTEQAARSEHSAQFVRDVKAHINDLAGKKYQDNEQVLAHDCVLMFVPIEGALAAALTSDPELFTYAWDKRVVLVGPPTLLMTLRTVASVWRYELQAQNAQDIAKLAGLLCDKVSASLSDLNTVAEKMQQAFTAHNDAVRRLSTGKGNAISVGERIRSLGVKTKTNFPAMLVEGERITAELDFDEAEAEAKAD